MIFFFSLAVLVPIRPSIYHQYARPILECSSTVWDAVVVVVVLLSNVLGKHLRSCRDGQLTLPHFPGQAYTSQAVNQYFVHILSLVTDNCPI